MTRRPGEGGEMKPPIKPITAPPGYMTAVCCNCNRFLGYVPAAPTCEGMVSHGICEKCEKKLYGKEPWCKDIK